MFGVDKTGRDLIAAQFSHDNQEWEKFELIDKAVERRQKELLAFLKISPVPRIRQKALRVLGRKISDAEMEEFLKSEALRLAKMGVEDEARIASQAAILRISS